MWEYNPVVTLSNISKHEHTQSVLITIHNINLSNKQRKQKRRLWVSHDPSWHLICETQPQLHQANVSWATSGSLGHRCWPESGLGLLISHVSMSWLTFEMRRTFHACVKFSFIHWTNNQSSYRNANKLKCNTETWLTRWVCTVTQSPVYSVHFLLKNTHNHLFCVPS